MIAVAGILPIKKIRDESALNNFDEYTMLKSKPITRYFGFTEEEIKELCDKYDMDFDSYWKNTSSFESINTFITMNYEGLKDDVLTMLSGGKMPVNTETFGNDFSEISSKDEALTALLHLGYLAYDAEEGSAFIPNFEVVKAFQAALNKGSWHEIAKSISKCDELLRATIAKDADKAAQIIELAHETYTSVLKYNDENSLSGVLTMAYFTAPAYYNIVREFPSGKGFADLVFIPRANAGNRPAMKAGYYFSFEIPE